MSLRLDGREQHLALGDVALDEEERVGLRGLAALQLGTGAGHQHRQAHPLGLIEHGAGMVAVVGAYDSVAGVGLHVGGIALAGVGQGVGQLGQVGVVLVVVAQVQLHALGAFLLCLVDVAHGIVDGGLKTPHHAARQDDINIDGHHLLGGLGLGRLRVVIALAGNKGEDGYTYYIYNVSHLCIMNHS